MTVERFMQLSQSQQWGMMLAIEARNALEKFHASDEYGLIPDSLMPEMNRLLRDHLYKMIYALLNPEKIGSQQQMAWAVQLIPDYWEIPELTVEEQEWFDNGFYSVPKSPENKEAK